MSENDNTQNSQPSQDTLNAFETMQTMNSNLDNYLQAIIAEDAYIVTALASTDYNPTIVDEIAADLETHIPVVNSIKAFFQNDLTVWKSNSETFAAAADHESVESIDEMIVREQYMAQLQVEFNNRIDSIDSCMSAIELRKIPDDMKEEFNSALAEIINIGNPLAEMCMATPGVIQSLVSIYNTCYRTPIDEILAMQGQAKPLTREELIVLVDGVNNFLSHVFTALIEKDEIYANCVSYINNLPETVRNHYYITSILGQLDMMLGMINANEETIKVFSVAINEGIPTPGPKGDTGHVGDTGSKGDKGNKGDTGPSGTLTLDYLKLGLIFGAGSVFGAIISAMMCFFCN